MGEAHAVAWRWGAPGIAAAALLASLGGLRGVASLLLLAAIVAAAVRLLDAVGLAAEGRGDRFVVASAVTGLVWLVAAGVSHVVWLAVGVLACAAVESVGRSRQRVELPAEPVELRRAA